MEGEAENNKLSLYFIAEEKKKSESFCMSFKWFSAHFPPQHHLANQWDAQK